MLRAIKNLSKQEAVGALVGASRWLREGGNEPPPYALAVLRESSKRLSLPWGPGTELDETGAGRIRRYLQDQVAHVASSGDDDVDARLGRKGLLSLDDFRVVFYDALFLPYSSRRSISKEEVAQSLGDVVDVVHLGSGAPHPLGLPSLALSYTDDGTMLLLHFLRSGREATMMWAYRVYRDWTPIPPTDALSALSALVTRYGLEVAWGLESEMTAGYLFVEQFTDRIPRIHPEDHGAKERYFHVRVGDSLVPATRPGIGAELTLNWSDPGPEPGSMGWLSLFFALDSASLDAELVERGVAVRTVEGVNLSMYGRAGDKRVRVSRRL